MKKVLAFLLTVLTALSLTATALADVVWEPNNEFYRKHWRQCESHLRDYYANGPDGFVTLWDAPNGSTVRTQFENGTRLDVAWTYKNWGCVCLLGDESLEQDSGWVPLDQLYLIYDHISFEEEYGEDFEPYAGQFDTSVLKEGSEIWFWEYPYAREPITKFLLNEHNINEFEDFGVLFTQTYTDRNGNVWGYGSYVYSYRNFWVLLENPTCEGVMTSCIPEADDLITSGEIVPPQTPVLPTVSYLPYFLVAGVVAVTAVLLVMMKRRSRRTSD